MLQVFRPFVCDLRPWNLQSFMTCTAERRLILIGDTSMHLMFNSLACLLHSSITSGSQIPWQARASSTIPDEVSATCFPVFSISIRSQSGCSCSECGWYPMEDTF
jgi:hypothetical protein